jgi:hypothetical protein
LNFKTNNNINNKDKKKNLDASNSINATTKLCDLARLEEAEEEKNFFDKMQIGKLVILSLVRLSRKNPQGNLVNFLQIKNQVQNYLLGSDKKINHNVINK